MKVYRNQKVLFIGYLIQIHAKFEFTKNCKSNSSFLIIGLNSFVQVPSPQSGRSKRSSQWFSFGHQSRMNAPLPFTIRISLLFQNSLTIKSNALADDGIKNARAFDKFQFERLGYFSVDSDSTDEKVGGIFFTTLIKTTTFFFFFF